jgi:hypothetical protein
MQTLISLLDKFIQLVTNAAPLLSTHLNFFFQWRNITWWARPRHWRGFTITLRHTTLGRIPLDEWSARRKDYLTTHNIHERKTSMPPAGFEPTIPASRRPQTHALDRAATGIGTHLNRPAYLQHHSKHDDVTMRNWSLAKTQRQFSLGHQNILW